MRGKEKYLDRIEKVLRNAQRCDKQQLCVLDLNDVTLVEAPVIKLGPAISPHEINLSGSQVLAVFLSALSTIGLLLWAVLKVWLFEP